ncbi:DUF1501 domain-containing protein [Aeoliella sp. ICT_H6.2]|uniref:DUF1501 domain-containing protein n=1 Tax=Aeoliella straminimaris TaxID=2954799 RepID=A0A9X2JIJ2_9BACT|nr:DUF1501 domain-containing protein [Aeoliella straminimaris]MCO6046901.1 DUF1501 domain-containing protein [Aeoliella straminimaris]
MNLTDHLQLATLQHHTRRHFLQGGMAGLGAYWLAANAAQASSGAVEHDPAHPLEVRQPHFTPRAKRVIFLHMAGAPSQLELFEHKPDLDRLNGQDCPQEFLEGQRFAFIRGVPKLLGSCYPFHQAGGAGQWISDRLPHFEQVIDKVTFIRSMTSDQFNHAPAQLLMHTGNQNLGYASMGSWLGYGLGSENQNLPGFMVLVSGGRVPSAGKSAWGAGFLPSVYQGVQCRSEGDPVLFLSNPKGIDRAMRERILSAINQVNQDTYQEFGDPETLTRIAQYEMAANMQLTASAAMDLADEPEHIHQLYGTQPGRESFANNCVLARRLVERGVRFVQLFHWGWDSHGASQGEALNSGFKQRCAEVDQPMAALLTDLEQRGLLEDTLVVFAGEFGRTPMRENRGGREMQFVGRDHHPHAFTIWLAGGGVKQGFSYGETDPIGYHVTKDPVEVRDLHATLWHLLGLDHQKLVYPHQGLNQKLTGVKPARVVHDIVA